MKGVRYRLYRENDVLKQTQCWVSKFDDGLVVQINTQLVPDDMLMFHRILLRNFGPIVVGSAAEQWLERRVWKEHYQWLPMLLEEAGLDRYDRWKLFLFAHGRCAYDDMEIDMDSAEEISKEDILSEKSSVFN